MALSRSITLIKTNMNDKFVDTGIQFCSNFGYNIDFKISTSIFNEFFLEFLELSNQEENKYINDSKDDDFDPTKYGLPICEKIPDNTPIIIEMNFSFQDFDCDCFYDHTFLIEICYLIQQIIIGFVKINDDGSNNPSELRCFVLESAIWKSDDKQFQSIRFQFPFTLIPKYVLNSYVIKELCNILIEKDFIKKLHKTPLITNWCDIIKKAENYLPLYGCKYTQNSAPLILTSVYSFIDEESDIDENYMNSYFNRTYETDETLDPCQSGLIETNLLQLEDVSFNDKKVNLPLILSVQFWNKLSKIIPDTIKIGDTPSPFINVKRETAISIQKDEQKLFIELINFVNPNRFTEEYKYYWYEIIKTTHNIFNGSENGYQIILNLTKDEVLREELNTVWEKCTNEYLDIRTIMAYAEEDNPSMYEEWLKEYYKPLIEKAKTGKNMVMAELVERVLCTKFVYDPQNKVWYQFKRSYLVKDVGHLEFRNIISLTLKKIYNEHKEIYEEERKTKETPDQKKIHAGLIKEIEKLMDKLDDTMFLDRIIVGCQSKMYDYNLTNKMDENLLTMACTNVVIECYDKTITYRPGKLQDYITMSTRIAFPISYTENTKQVQFVRHYYKQLHVDDEMRNFFEIDQSSYLEGGNNEKLFRNLIGEKNRSKSEYAAILQAAMGDYCVDLPVDEITYSKYKNDTGPNPHLDRARGARLAFINETGKNKPIDKLKVKKFTTNDRYVTRGMNQSGGPRVMGFKLMVFSNEKMSSIEKDEAYDSREVIFPYISEWCYDAPTDISEQFRLRKFPIDDEFRKRIPGLAQAQLFIMFSDFHRYKKVKLRKIIPKLIKDATEKHQLDNDTYYNFIKERLVKYENDDGSKDKSKTISVFDLFNQYKRWFPTFCPDTRININLNEFKNEMCNEKLLGTLNFNNQWEGIGIKNM